MANQVQTNSSIQCEHSSLQHFFQSPLCGEKSTIEKVLTVVFHILTFCIPLAIYKIFSSIYPCDRSKISTSVNTLPTSPSISPVTLATIIDIVKSSREKRPKFPFSQIGQEALDFARAELLKQPELTPIVINRTPNMKQPQNKEIALLLGLHKKYINESDSIYKNNLTSFGSIRMESEEVQELIEKCMKIAYAIGSLTLEEIAEQAQGSKSSFQELLFAEDSFSFVTTFILPEGYKHIPSGFRGIFDGKNFTIPETIYKPLTCFYEEGTKWNSLRELHNDFITRFNKHVGYETAIKFDSWLKEDLDTTFQDDHGCAPYHFIYKDPRYTANQKYKTFWLPMYS